MAATTLNKVTTMNIETPTFMYTAYGITWLNATPPPFNTENEAILPFTIGDRSTKIIDGEKWTGQTTAFYADVDCKTAISENREVNRLLPSGRNDTDHFFVDEDTGCAFRHQGYTENIPIDNSFRPYYAQWVGYNAGPSANYYLKTPNCQLAEDPHMFFIVVAHKDDANATAAVNAQFCKAKYRATAAEVTVDANAKKVLNVTHYGEPRDLTDEELDSTILETVVTGGGVQTPVVGYSGPFLTNPRHAARLRQVNEQLTNSDWDFESSALGFVFAQNPDLGSLMDPKTLSDAVSRAYRLLFMSYVAMNLVGQISEPITATRSFEADTVVVEKVYARILEGLLASVALLLVGFLIASTRRKTGLVSDPASLAGTMAYVAKSDKLLEKFKYTDGTSTEQEMYQAISGCTFKLESKEEHYQLVLGQDDQANGRQTTRDAGAFKSDQERNIELSTTAGCIFIALLGGIFIFIIYIYNFSVNNNGLPSISSNVFVFQLIFSYIPTAVATLIEPFWVLLTRFLCVLQPLETLRKGHALASESLSLKFESMPPALTTVTALRSRHFFLAVLATTALSTNFLAIAFGGLFSPTLTLEVRDATFLQTHSMEIDAVPQIYSQGIVRESRIAENRFPVGEFDHYYTLYTNLTNNTNLPAWTTHTEFFFPFEVGTLQPNNSTQFWHGRTLGARASLECDALGIDVQFSPNTTGPVEVRLVSSPLDDSEPQCETYFKITQTRVNEDDISYVGPVKLNFYPKFTSVSNQTEDTQYCEGLVPMVHAKAAWNRNNTVQEFRDGFEMKGQVCRPRMEAKIYDVTVDESYQVVSAEEVTDQDPAAGNIFGGKISEPEFFAAFRSLFDPSSVLLENIEAGTAVPFHTSDFTFHWIDVPIQLLSNSTDFVDPEKPIPDMGEMGKLVGRVYSMAFGVTMGLYYEQMLGNLEVPVEIAGAEMVKTTRVEMSTFMFAVSGGLLGWYVILALYFYLFRVSRLFQRLPTSLASEIQLFHSSRALDDMQGTELLTTRQRNDYLTTFKKRYGFGRFIGRDGVLRVGIEQEPLLDHMSDGEVRNQGLGRVGLAIERVFGRARKSSI
ncbi:hypothetical protein ABW19_dt0203924 [Dactylella cylindrospora]|nr:hypothetical protein ABW19_dt0203924 [Dactylella cylindrospora]